VILPIGLSAFFAAVVKLPLGVAVPTTCEVERIVRIRFGETFPCHVHLENTVSPSAWTEQPRASHMYFRGMVNLFFAFLFSLSLALFW
jgi:hypothetical protein